MDEEQKQIIFEENLPSQKDDFNIDIFFSLEDIANQSNKNACQIDTPITQNQISWAHIVDGQEPSQTSIQSINSGGLFSSKSFRQKQFIEISQRKRNEYVQACKGQRQETAELNINFKTITKGILREEFLFNNFTSEEQNVIRNFQQSNANFQSFRELFGVEEIIDQKDEFQETKQDGFKRNQRRTQTQFNAEKNIKSMCEVRRTSRRHNTDKSRKCMVTKKSDRIRKICLQNFSSCRLIRETLKSCRMNPNNKLITIKFLEQMRDGCIKPQDFTNWKAKLTNRN